METESTRHLFTMFTIIKSRGSSFGDYRVFTCLQTEEHNDCVKHIAGMRNEIKSTLRSVIPVVCVKLSMLEGSQ